MRDIKFRGKGLEIGKWVYGDLIENQGRFFIYHATSETTVKDDDDNKITIVATEVDNNTVGQFSGLRDCNGKEIYEGDIVWHKLYERYYECKWVEDHACFAFDEDGYGETFYVQKCDAYKLILKGNIHDNLDLLENEN